MSEKDEIESLISNPNKFEEEAQLKREPKITPKQNLELLQIQKEKEEKTIKIIFDLYKSFKPYVDAYRCSEENSANLLDVPNLIHGLESLYLQCRNDKIGENLSNREVYKDYAALGYKDTSIFKITYSLDKNRFFIDEHYIEPIYRPRSPPLDMSDVLVELKWIIDDESFELDPGIKPENILNEMKLILASLIKNSRENKAKFLEIDRKKEASKSFNRTALFVFFAISAFTLLYGKCTGRALAGEFNEKSEAVQMQKASVKNVLPELMIDGPQ